MGTNYYLLTDVCKHCGRPAMREHIGKDSAGWCFSLHVGREWEGWIPHTLAGWQELWDKPDAVIEDEYRERLTPEEMVDTIVNEEPWERDRGAVPTGYGSWEKFFDVNQADIGPRNLLRHRLSGRCVGHGDGTYDLIVGDFC